MKKEHLFLFTFAIVLLCNSVYALEPEYIFKAGEIINFKNPCINNGSFCSSSAVCNLTVLYPDGSIFIDSVVMDNNGSFHSYTFPVTWTSGFYSYTQACNDNGQKGLENNYLQITPTGETGLLGFFIVVFLVCYLILAWGVISKEPILGMLGTFALAVLGLYTLFFGIDIYKNYLTNTIAIITLGISGYFGVTIMLDYLE